jgi:subtilase family serine protease
MNSMRCCVQLSDPASPNFGHYLSPEQFAAEFGPTEQDYQALIQFAHENGLVVTGTHPNRVLLDVSAEVSQIEQALQIKMMAYDHPVRGEFYAPDREPWLDLEVKVLDISGLDNFILPQPMSPEDRSSLEVRSHPYVAGSGPGGYFIGKDFRAAYAPGVSLTGSGQVVGLLEFDGFYPGDVQKNAAQAGMTPVPTQTVLLDGFNGAPGKSIH